MNQPNPPGASDWNASILKLPGCHILQTTQWSQLKAEVGWQALPQLWGSPPHSAALVLQRSIPTQGFAARLRILYAPKGPLLDWTDPSRRSDALQQLQSLAKRQRAIFIKIDPDVVVGPGQPGEAVRADLLRLGWVESREQVQFRSTMWIDLTPGEETLLANMKQKTRYNIRLAERKGVTVRPGGLEDLGLLYRMYAETSIRDRFVIRDEAYYRRAWGSFLQAGLAEILVAEAEGEAVAGLVLFHFGTTAWYFYGMSTSRQREKMPNYLLQWEAMRLAKARGCTRYDLWGAPDEPDEQDPMWGVYRFKEGLGGQLVRTLGAWDYPVSPFWYYIYTQAMPKILDALRRRGRQRTQSSLGM
jgi:lipid II:glycine glycyltransferase (peptidoglycan interpeptide bridge formation enzyme)